MTTATEKYIQKAVQEAKKEFAGSHINNCNFALHMKAKGATKKLAEALAEQAKANALTSQAMLKLAEALKPVEACAIKIVQDKISSPFYEENS